ncbi:MYG1 family protein [Pseudosulfitobacter pseudonitzschiae]|uniref:MYG1 family protein n=1 Tax=Pseudosulfitobacter pseudonitzschiae TaxID=1402135 RepID=UPI003B7F2DDF
MNIEKLVTHSGKFHIDEVMSTMILQELYPAAEIIRTRDEDIIKEAVGNAVIYDVGSMYDPDHGIYDHHQQPGPLRDDEVPYSSFGLIWKHFGRDFLRKIDCAEENIETIWSRFDRHYVRPVDMIDNGVISPSGMGEVRALSLASMISDLNPPYYAQTRENENDLFFEALDIAVTAVMARLEQMTADLAAQQEVQTAIEAQWGSEVLILEQGLPYNQAIEKLQADHIKLVVHPRSDGDWIVAGVPLIRGEYPLRMDLPKSWGGLEGKALQQATEVAGAVFCHAKLFMAVGRSREDATEMAKEALSLQQAPSPS